MDKDCTKDGCPVPDRDVGTVGLDYTPELSGENVEGTAPRPESCDYFLARPPEPGARATRHRGLRRLERRCAAALRILRVLCRRSQSARSQHGTAAAASQDPAGDPAVRAALAMATLESARTRLRPSAPGGARLPLVTVAARASRQWNW